MIEDLLKEAKKYNQRRMIVTTIDKLDSIKNVLGDYTIFSDDIKGARRFKEVRKIMGQTLGHVIIDARKGFLPSDFGIIVGAVSGGHIIVLIKKEPWENKKFHKWMESPNNPRSKFKDNFLKWFESKLKSASGVFYKEYKKPEIVLDSAKNIVFPECGINRKILSLAVTQDQVDTICGFDNSRISVLIADRGRGKSSALGLYLAHYIQEGSKVCVTAPGYDNVKELFKFFERGLNAINTKYKKGQKEYIIGDSTVNFVEPYLASKEDWDLVIVDEAAAIPVTLLLKLLTRSKKIIFSSTIHGYEGGGRSFYIKFMGELTKSKIKYNLIKMSQPIRYSNNDPIEKFVFESLLLDAEPEKIDEIDLSKVKLVLPKKKDLINDEKTLKSYFGIFVLAHYKNNPNDLALILDAPAHIPAYLEYNGKIIASIQLVKEGSLSEETIDECYEGIEINGELITDRVIRHYRMKNFGKYKGIRIVRIAVHPDHLAEGIGSLALKLIENHFSYDWIGASFGATYELLNFWVKNGYAPIHISPSRNQITGEYSFIVIKGKVRELTILRNEFVKKIFNSLNEIYKDLELSIVRLLKRIHNKDRLPSLTQVQWERLKAYLDGILTYEVTYDAIREIVYSYFLSKAELLDKETEEILIGKVLQNLDFHKVQNIFHLPRTAVYSRIKKGVSRIFEYFEHRLSLNFVD